MIFKDIEADLEHRGVVIERKVNWKPDWTATKSDTPTPTATTPALALTRQLEGGLALAHSAKTAPPYVTKLLRLLPRLRGDEAIEALLALVSFEVPYALLGAAMGVSEETARFIVLKLHTE